MRIGDTLFVCQCCRQVFDDKPFDTASGNGVTVKANSTSLCADCVKEVTIKMLGGLRSSRKAK